MKEHIIQLLEQTVTILKEQQIIPADVQPRIAVDRTRDKAHGDLATNLAMMMAKPAKKNPRELAQLIIDNLPESDLISRTEIAGPGFINIFLNQNWLAQQIDIALADDNLSVQKTTAPDTVVVDLSSPNLAKEMHVGHLRSSIIGDSIARTLELLGHHVIRQNHVGDWGTQFGMLLAYMEEKRAENVEISMQLSDLEVFYRAAKGRFDESEDFAIRAREMVVMLQSGDEACNKLWKEFNDVSLAHCHDIYKRLNVKLTRDDVRGESFYNSDLHNVVAELEAQGLLTESNGAKCVFLDEFKNKDGDPLPVIIQKNGGGFLYATTDLAAMRYRQQTLNANRIMYFVDQRQALHFQQVFSVAQKAGFVKPETSLEHLGFGTMNGEDGRPFKTRSGGTVKLVDLLTEAEERAYTLVKAKNPNLAENELKHIARVVGISSVKYADLSKNRSSDYIFNFDSMLSFEGNTAPYLLYACTRVSSIFNKVDTATVAKLTTAKVQLNEDKEQELAGKLIQFNEIVHHVAKRATPNTLCTYLFELAGVFSSFYEACPILSTEDEAIKLSRLKLAQLTAKTLKQGLDLLGIETLERM
ncbi:arginine--tRNA ligase [Moritella yayanosii]|uniref:Arginine--tRNA ligase n=1 Tax=Moritella yayanosii TaxID=69539 RepID=A0A330LTL6_9GAMM|nr:arginine--tRNA ligase [Moritella yayanosii]SQD79311.1 arginyl-tRNA synthetase [Moritella yayanosii]